MDIKDIHVCFATDDNYALYCAVAIKSIIINADDDDRLFIYILHKDLTEDKVQMLKEMGSSRHSSIEFIRINKGIFEDMPLIAGAHFSHIETYFRFAIPRVLQNLKKVLYLDCDILVRGSLWALYNTQLNNKAVGMIIDKIYKSEVPTKQDFNAGVMLINCEKWRNEGIENKLMQYINKNYHKIKNQDQEVINGTLQNDIYELDSKYNKQIYMNDLSNKSIDEIMQDHNIVILHYITDIKPWHGVYQNKLTDEYFSHMKGIPAQFKDLRSRYKNIDKTKYYNDSALLRYLIHENMISRSINLLLVYEREIKKELEYAAQDLGFLNIRSNMLADIGAKSGEDSFMIIDSREYGRIKEEMTLLGYIYREDYDLTCSLEYDRLEKTLIRHNVGSSSKVIIYGTATWAEKCTEVLDKLAAEILFYMDSDRKKDGNQIYGKAIMHPDRFALCGLNYDKIVIASSAYNEIEKTLLSLGVDKENIIHFDI